MPRLKGMRKPLQRYARRLLIPIAALAGVLTLTAATLTEPAYSGTGWKALTSKNIYSLSPEPYTIVFADTTARSVLTPYFTGPAGQVTTEVGVPITVTTTIDTTPTSSCPAKHRIVVHYRYQPLGVKGMSQARPCYNTTDGSAWGGHVLMDSEYWTSPTWFSTNSAVNDAKRRDATTHELGHILGLDHPNTDLDGDATVEAQECVSTSGGLKPVMCSPNPWGGPIYQPTYGTGTWSTANAGRYTAQFDLPGLRQLLRNYTLRQG